MGGKLGCAWKGRGSRRGWRGESLGRTGKAHKKDWEFGWEKGGGRVGGGLKSKRERKDGGEN